MLCLKQLFIETVETAYFIILLIFFPPFSVLLCFRLLGNDKLKLKIKGRELRVMPAVPKSKIVQNVRKRDTKANTEPVSSPVPCSSPQSSPPSQSGILSINDLPKEVLARIFSYLDLRNLAKVGKGDG